MSYGLIVNKEELRKLDYCYIDYDFWNGYDLFGDNSEQLKQDEIEIEFEHVSEYNKALELLYGKDD